MTCPKCTGLMVQDRADDMDSGIRIDQWRCMICGKRVDPVMEHNMAHGPELETNPRLVRGGKWRRIRKYTPHHNARGVNVGG